jgi:3-hydroxyacyl-CoA dehydrogenase/enoyl-CoA hydratase/3-hydroxybutyryl-CoA epimerase
METLFTGKAFKFVKDGKVGILNFDLEGEKVNKISQVVAGELELVLQQFLGSDADIRAILIRSLKKNSFIVGADINLIKTLKDESEAFGASGRGQAIFSRLEDLKIPTLVAIDGPCMGGGTELAASCKYRVCSDFEKTVIAVPEVKLGLLPGWGGTFRLPRLIGLPNGLDMILTGKNIRPEKALKMGLVDMVVPKAIFEEKCLELAHLLADGKDLPGRKARNVSLQEKLLTSNLIGRRIVFQQARAGVMKATRGNYPAPLKALSVIEKNWNASREKHMAAEAKVFGELWATPVSKNLVDLFFLMEDAKKLTGTLLSEEQVRALPPVRELGVLGAGVMGGGVAAQAASSGVRTVVKDINFDAIGKALAHARSLFDSELRKKRIKPNERDKRMSLIRGQLDTTGFRALDLVIEAIVENMDVKKKVLAEIEADLRADCIIGTNTSSLSVSEMSKALKDPSRFVGIHFFNPVHKMPLVEIIRHAGSSEEVTARAVAFAKAIGKTPVVVKDGPGFLVNRLLMPWLNEAAWCLIEGFEIKTLDRVAKDFGMPMGPCELIDEVGIDVACKVSHILFEAFGERAQPSPATDKVMDDNKGKDPKQQRLGRKSGLGFYKWEKPGGKRVEPDTEAVNRILFGANPPRQPEYSDEGLVRRMFYPMINEAARALKEGIVESPAQLDLAMIFGTGFPPFRGGPCRYAYSVALKKIEAELDRMANLHGERMKASEALREFASQGAGRFYAT